MENDLIEQFRGATKGMYVLFSERFRKEIAVALSRSARCGEARVKGVGFGYFWNAARNIAEYEN